MTLHPVPGGADGLVHEGLVLLGIPFHVVLPEILIEVSLCRHDSMALVTYGYSKGFRHCGLLSFTGALHQSRNEGDGNWVLGKTIPDLKFSLQLKRHVCIELRYLDPRIVRRVTGCDPGRGCPARSQS